MFRPPPAPAESSLLHTPLQPPPCRTRDTRQRRRAPLWQLGRAGSQRPKPHDGCQCCGGSGAVPRAAARGYQVPQLQCEGVSGGRDARSRRRPLPLAPPPPLPCAASLQHCPRCPRRYILRRAREGFREGQHERDSGVLQQLWGRAQHELEVVKRQRTVYSLYARKQKSVLVGGWVDGRAGGALGVLVSCGQSRDQRRALAPPPARLHRKLATSHTTSRHAHTTSHVTPAALSAPRKQRQQQQGACSGVLQDNERARRAGGPTHARRWQQQSTSGGRRGARALSERPLPALHPARARSETGRPPAHSRRSG